MLRRIPADEYARFWKEYSTNIKLGVMEDPSNRARLAKLLRFHSSHAPQPEPDAMVALEDYVQRMKPAQKHIYYIAGASRAEVPPPSLLLYSSLIQSGPLRCWSCFRAIGPTIPSKLSTLRSYYEEQMFLLLYVCNDSNSNLLSDFKNYFAITMLFP